MTVYSLHDFCRELLSDRPFDETLEPEALAAKFVDRFRVSRRPSLEELKRLMHGACFGRVEARSMDTALRGAHFAVSGSSYLICYRKGMWRGAAEHTVLHEAFEIVCETLLDMRGLSQARRTETTCRSADRFAAAVLMQPEAFAARARGCGLDVIALHREFGRSFASVTMRLAEVLDDLTFMAVLYETRYGRLHRNRKGRLRSDGALRASVVSHKPEFEDRTSQSPQRPRGCGPILGMTPKNGSLAARAARTGRSLYAESEGSAPQETGFAVVARPVIWRRRLTKVVVVAVPYEQRDCLAPQLSASSFERLRIGIGRSDSRGERRCRARRWDEAFGLGALRETEFPAKCLTDPAGRSGRSRGGRRNPIRGASPFSPTETAQEATDASLWQHPVG